MYRRILAELPLHIKPHTLKRDTEWGGVSGGDYELLTKKFLCLLVYYCCHLRGETGRRRQRKGEADLLHETRWKRRVMGSKIRWTETKPEATKKGQTEKTE